MHDESKELLKGTWYGASAYMLWGILPIYWKLVNHVPSDEILAHRIIWSLLFMIIILISLNKWKGFITDCKVIFRNKKTILGVSLASLFISINWFTYIWAVNNNQIVETSLGYYINPLISVLLGIIVLKEKLSSLQAFSVILAAIGVLYLTINYGSFPWIAITLALSFGFYGLAKKLVNIGALTGLTIETLMITPVALLYLTFIHSDGGGSFELVNSSTTLLLMGAGAVTAIPLLLFASGARRIPLSLIGFLQYIAPTLQLLLGVFLYHEPFTDVHVVSFTFIWIALITFTVSRTKWVTRRTQLKKAS